MKLRVWIKYVVYCVLCEIQTVLLIKMFEMFGVFSHAFFCELLTQMEIYSLVHSSYRMGCFLCIGLTFAHFRLFGKIPVAIATFAHILSPSDAWSNFFHGEIWWLFIFFEEKWFKFSGFTTYPIINFLSESFGHLI